MFFSIVILEAKKKGVKFGRKRKIDRLKVRELHKAGIPASVIASQLKIGRSTVYKLIDDLKSDKL